MNAYLDYAATSPLDGEILEAMLPVLKENFGNPDSLHAYGRRAAYAVSQARDSVAETLGVQPQEVYFTSGGTEADNWAVRRLGKGSVLVSAIEHAAVLSAAAFREDGYALVGADTSGMVSAKSVEEALNADTGLVCVMAVNNETGTIQPLKEISALCRSRGVLLFSDCVQAARSLRLGEICALADALSLSAHKIGGPKGIGALIVRKGAPLSPLLSGGEQERGLRGGTLNVAGIVGLAAALKKAQRERERFCAHTGALRDLFERTVISALGERVRRDGEYRVPCVSHLTFAGGGALLNKLDLCGVAASGGAACSAHAGLPSHVMLAMGRSEEEARSGIRFSFGPETTEEETVFAARAVIRCMKG